MHLDQIASARTAVILALEARLCEIEAILHSPLACIHRGTQNLSDSPINSEVCQLLQLGIMKMNVPSLEQPNPESPFRKRSINNILFDVANIDKCIARILGHHKDCLKGHLMLEYASKCVANVEGLSFDKSWNLHHGKYPAHS